MTLLFVRLPVETIEALPHSRATWISHLNHALDVARRLPPGVLAAANDVPSITRSVRLRPTDGQIAQLNVLQARTGWGASRTLAAVLHIALLDSHSMLFSQPYAAKYRRRLAS